MKPITIVSDALMITGFVFAVMLVVEHLDVATRVTLQRFAGRKGVAAYSGSVLPGMALGWRRSFAAVRLDAHGSLPFGAIVAHMIAAGGFAGLALGGIGPRAARVLGRFGIATVLGIAGGEPEEVVCACLDGTLTSSGEGCVGGGLHNCGDHGKR